MQENTCKTLVFKALLRQGHTKVVMMLIRGPKFQKLLWLYTLLLCHIVN